MKSEEDRFAEAMNFAHKMYLEPDGMSKLDTCLYYNFEPYFFSVSGEIAGQRAFKETDLIREMIDYKWGKNETSRLHSFRNAEDIPIWEGEGYVHCIVTYNCNYILTHHAPLDTIVNLWMDKDGATREASETHGWVNSTLQSMNLDQLKRSDFVSKRANPHTITNTDLNKILEKFSKQIKN
jgi:hypothetical protein